MSLVCFVAKNGFVGASLVIIIFLTLSSETIQEKRKNHYSFVASCPVSAVFRHVRSTQKEQYQQPQRGSGARG